MEDLLLKKCVPCDKNELGSMREGTANRFRLQVPKWELVTSDGVMKLRRKWKVKSFLQGLEFFKVVANLAQAEGPS
ncbi:hypothetical protein L2E82_39652 [Cichorium intybus]|uniref:Uncharacterized protein n=1 Tax=Cichorium intybus TaxID=13427 RepID=A0ACB9AJT3_CICIN|nr:hypothetical protein L2E82_39652 [Cichorium intybus]